MRTLTLLGLALLGACRCQPDPYQATLSDNVGAAFAPCTEAEIKFLARKHNVQLAFQACGQNAFKAYAWSPDGLLLYFQLPITPYIMDADAPNRATTPVPIPEPTANAAWLASRRLAVPVVAAEGTKDPRIAMYDLPAKPDADGAVTPGSLVLNALPGLTNPRDLHRGDTSRELFFIAEDAGGEARLWRHAVDESTTEPAFTWLADAHKQATGQALRLTSFTYTPTQQLLTVSDGSGVWVYTAEGAPRGTWTPATRGVVDPQGAWIALEHPGEPVSSYYQRTWDEMSDGARRRERQRADQLKSRLPAGMDHLVHPPTLSFARLDGGDRYLISAFLGSRFTWYEAAENWGSFFLWGFEGKQFKRNVGLVDLLDRLRSIESGKGMLGVERMGPETKAGVPIDEDATPVGDEPQDQPPASAP